MSEKCRFQTDKHSCKILSFTECDGMDKSCGFFKTEEQYIAEYNRAVALNRAKGNCSNCKYQKKPCPFMEAVNDT